MSDFAARRRAMVASDLAARDIRDPRVLAAMGEVPREEFVPEALRRRAYEDGPLPIGLDQTISQPYIVALMLEALELKPGDRMLEVGLGSGYAAAVASRIVARVHAIDRFAELAETARERLQRLGYANIEVRAGDGTLGWPEHAPYDAILVSAAAPRLPEALREQLADGGRVVIPVGGAWYGQSLERLRRNGDKLERQTIAAVAFVPLIGKQGWDE